MMHRLFAIVIYLCTLPTAVAADTAYRITFDQGGVVDSYIEKYNAMRLAGGRVVLDGVCESACTLVTALIPPSRLCITERALLGFHSVTAVNMHTGERRFDLGYTRMMWRMQPASIRALVSMAGWDGESEHEGVVYVEADALSTLYPICGDD